MTRVLRSGLSALLATLVLSIVPVACQSGGVGDPCTPEEEYDATFTGFDLRQEYIESRSFQCSTRLCLVNHFQGRVSCPLGQPSSIVDCGGDGGAHDEMCDAEKGERCVESGALTISCDPAQEGVCESFGAVCDGARGLCVCGPDTVPPEGYHCSPSGGVSIPKRFVCHVPGSCQDPGASAAQNAGKDCCVPGTDTPVNVPVCGQCSKASRRAADDAVYCSCRCGVADGAPDEPDFAFCKCPSGFTCSEIRTNLPLSDPLLTGKYCIKDDSAYTGTPASCGVVEGNAEGVCGGVAER